MVLDLYFPLFAILTAYLIAGAVACVAASILLGTVLDRIQGFRDSIRAERASRVVVGVA
jgi:hypothetical protein